MKALVNTATPRDQLLCTVHGRDAIDRRRMRLHEPHIAPLTEWVQTVRERLDTCHARTVADFDPKGGGVVARVMYLAQDPSSTAAETGFISPDNNDPTAKATTEACHAAKVDSAERVHWNVYPWWQRAPCPIALPRSDKLAQDMLTELVALLPAMKSVVLIGGEAEGAWKRLTRTATLRSDLRVWSGPHPSYGWWNKPFRPGFDGRLGREVVVRALRETRDHAFPGGG